MSFEPEQKVAARHLKRNAYLYIRQSTLRQVVEHSESTQRQYALRQRAVALGWPMDKIIVIDSDLGQSGASAADREGFQKLVTEVSMQRAGIVLGLEVSRLARNSSDWHRLLEICALTDTLILDEDGIYDPSHFNDRLLLGLKGTMSEAELHVMRARLRGGLLNKARRGELRMPLPMGLVYDEQDRVVLDPDQQVQQAIRLFFETFRRTGAASAVVRAFRRNGIRFPRRPMDDPLGKLQWGTLQIVQAARLLHSPRYAGAFCYGRTRTRRNVEGGPTLQRLPREHWHTLIVGAHAGYISWEEYEHNQRKLLENAQAYGADRRGPPREGPALLQGLAICGVCGYRMTVHYHRSGARLIPEYLCQKSTAIHTPQRSCGAISGAELDRAIGELLVEGVTPLTLEVALAVQQELEQRAEEADRLRRTQVERARYEAELARRRFMRVDPDNRLVADSLESEWNEKLRLHDEELYGVGSGNRIYVINAVTVIATQAGSGSAFNPGSIGTNLGVDFNPTVDRIRVVSNTGQNLRLNQITGTVVDFDPNTNGIQTDNLLAYAQGDASFGQNPRVVGAAYTNNFTGGISTTLYGIDSSLDTLVRQGGPGGNPSPNLGALTTVGPLGVDVSEVTGFDIVGFDSAGFAAFTVAGETVSRLYRVDLNTGTTALVGTLGGSESIRDIAVIHYDVQLQDDISSTILRFSSTTGEYEYTDCAGPSRLTGTGGVTVNSTRVTFLDRGMGGQSLDRLLVAFVDPANARGLALVHSFITRTTRIINDSDLVNNSGLCP